MGRAVAAKRKRAKMPHNNIMVPEVASTLRSLSYGFGVPATLAFVVVATGAALWDWRNTTDHNMSAEPGSPAALPTPPAAAGQMFSDLGDNSCGIQVAPQFVSADEAAHLLQLVRSTGGWKASETGGAQFEVPRGSDTGLFPKAVNHDPVVRRIEERIASATGILVHPDEDMLSFARITTRGKVIRGGHYPPFGLHHESDTRPNRARTVLIYLEAPRRGGRTIFPLCGVPTSEPGKRERRQLFEDALGQQWGNDNVGYRRHVGIDPKMEHPFNDFLTDVCNKQDGFASSPVAGSAIMFDSVIPGTNVPYNLTWHAGCNVVDGTKIILQKFKELRFRDRPKAYATFRRNQYFPYRHLA